MSGWGQRLAICMILLPLSFLPQVLPTWLMKPSSHISDMCNMPPPSPGILHECLTSLLSLSLPSLSSPPYSWLHNSLAAHTTNSPPSLHMLAGTVAEQRRAAGTAVTLSKVRCFSEPQFLPCKRQVLFTTSIKHFKVLWWMRPRNTQAS